MTCFYCEGNGNLVLAPRRKGQSERIVKCPCVSREPAGKEGVCLLTAEELATIKQHYTPSLCDADVVAAIFREEVYKRDDPDIKGKAKLFVLKQRNGPIGDIDLNFISEFTKFVDPAPEGENF
jgi:hypothetical protein